MDQRVPWYAPYGFKARKVKPSEHDPKTDLFAGESNVCCPKCDAFIKSPGCSVRNGLRCGKCGHVGRKKATAKKKRWSRSGAQ